MKLAPLRVGLLMRLVRYAPSFIQLFARLFSDPRVPWYARVVPFLGAFYLLFPLDLAADWFFLVGLVDDLLIIYGCLRVFVFLCPRHVVREHVARIERGE